jgi:hypothetical protein
MVILLFLIKMLTYLKVFCYSDFFQNIKILGGEKIVNIFIVTKQIKFRVRTLSDAIKIVEIFGLMQVKITVVFEK